MEPTELCKIMGECGSDKGNYHIKTSWHNYTLLYSKILSNIRYDNLRIFELGLGTNNINIKSNMGKDGKPGASLYGWSIYCPNSQIFGADIDKNILFQTDRIKTYYCDQLDAQIIKEMWSNPELNEPFDIIIEDGLHEFEANVTFFENSIHKLKQGGYYIIEDIIGSIIPIWRDKLNEWTIKYPHLQFDLLEIPSFINKWDNNLIIVQYKK
jgi:hypothetical protein